MFRKRKKLKEDFTAIFSSLSSEEQVALGSALMVEVYLQNPHKLTRALLDLEISRLAKRAEELKASNKELQIVLDEIKEVAREDYRTYREA